MYHFHNGSGGGVLSVIRNLLKYSQNPLIENHVIYTINKDIVQNFIVPKLEGAVTEQIFYYSAGWNFYYTSKNLAKLLPDDKAIIIAHDWLELGMVSNLGLQNKVVFFLHANYDYYFNLAKSHTDAINKFICVSNPIYNNLKEYLCERAQDILQTYFPVANVICSDRKNTILNIFYGVRDLTENRKQFLIIPEIDTFLRQAGVKVNWTVLGEGQEEFRVGRALHSLQNLTYYSQLKNEEVLKQLCTHDIFVLPSLKEGLPVALVEAMKAGLVPLISNWADATSDLVKERENGFYLNIGDAKGYAEAIAELNANRELLQRMSEKAVVNANQYFDPYKNTEEIESICIDAYTKEKKIKRAKKIYGSRLDYPLVPNFITQLIRKVVKHPKL